VADAEGDHRLGAWGEQPGGPRAEGRRGVRGLFSVAAFGDLVDRLEGQAAGGGVAESLGVQRHPVAPALHGVVVGGERGEAVLRLLLVLSAVAASTRS